MSRSRKNQNRRGGGVHPSGNYAKMRAVALDDMYYHLLRELALNRFKWHGLPSTIDERWMETCLLDYNLCLFFANLQNIITPHYMVLLLSLCTLPL